MAGPEKPLTEEEWKKQKYDEMVTNKLGTAETNYGAVRQTKKDYADTTYNATEEAANARADKQIKDAKDSYRRQYDANAIQEIVDQKALNERMANLGLSKSGLNATQQTAIALARGNRDASTTASQNQFIADTKLALQETLDKAAANREATKLAADQEYTNAIENTRLGLENSYNDYLNQQASAANAAQKTQNEYALALYKKYLEDGKYEEAAKIYNQLFATKNENGTGSAGTTPAKVDPKTIPYSQRVYEKTDDAFWDFLGTSDYFYDPIDNAYYTDDELEEKLRNERYREEWITGGDSNGVKDLEDIMDELEEGAYFSPASRRNASYLPEMEITDENGKTVLVRNDDYLIDYMMAAYDNDKEAQRSALERLGISEEKINKEIKAWYGEE